MSKIIRLNDETERLLETLRNQMKKDFKKNNIEILNDILDKDNIILQSALRMTIELGLYPIDTKHVK